MHLPTAPLPPPAHLAHLGSAHAARMAAPWMAAAGRPHAAAGGARSRGLSMCGFLAVVNSRLSPDALRLQTLTLQRLVRHRGPDGSGIHVVDSPDGQRCSSIAHERLAIVDPLSGNQPLLARPHSLARC